MIQMALQIENINKSYGVDVILKNISITAAENEHVGLIGRNGAGKSTLLKIIAGQIPYDSGRILLPKDSKTGFLRQDISEFNNKSISEYLADAFSETADIENELRVLERRMSEATDADERAQLMKSYGYKSELFEKRGGFETQTRINTVLNGMGFAEFDKNMKLSNLSGGERTKLSMAKLLLESPDVLLLDEPTNHLDFRTMQWLENYLRTYRGIVIAVSHDRYFLDKFADTIYEIENTRCVRYTGNYSAYLEQKKVNAEIQLKHYNVQQDEIKRLETYVEKNGVRASTAKSAKSKQKMIDRMELLEKPTTDSDTCKFSFDSVFRSYNDVLTVEDVALQVPKNGILETIAKNIDFDVKRGEKIAIVGTNGVGKSTLLKSIIGEHTFFSGEIEIGRNVRVGYYDQEQNHLDEKKTVFAAISDRFPLMDEVDIRTRLGSVLFTNEDVFKLIGDLSGGERARLMMLIIMLEKPNFLILDEPTNHLDLPAKEALDTAICSYEGTVLFVSHDRYFLNKTASAIFELTESGISRFKGNYDSYISAIEKTDENRGDTPKQNKSTSSGGSLDYEEQKRRQSMQRSAEKKLAAAEKTIAETEKRIANVNDELNACGSDFEKAKELYAESERLNGILEKAYEDWDEANTILENMNM